MEEMGSKYYGEPKLGTGGGSSSRKGKKKWCLDKPLQPQKGLGVAQLEKIRQMVCANYIPNPLQKPNYPFTNPIQEDAVRVQTAYSSASWSSSFSYTTPASSSYGFQGAQNMMEDAVRVQTVYSSASWWSSFSYTTPAFSSYGLQGAQNMMMDLGDSERANVRYNDSQPTTNNIARWNAGNTIINPQYYQQPYITRNLIDLEAEELMEKKKKGRGSGSMGSGSQNSGSSGSQELDLELRLSL